MSALPMSKHEYVNTHQLQLNRCDELSLDKELWAIAKAIMLSYGVSSSSIAIEQGQDVFLLADCGTDASRNRQYCSLFMHTIAARQLVVIADIEHDQKSQIENFVDGALGIRFYAGYPIFDEDGNPFGCISITDNIPRHDLRNNDFEFLINTSHFIKKIINNSREDIMKSSISSFVEACGVAIITSDASGMISSWNTAAKTTFGYSSAEVEGQNLSIIIPERFRANHAKGMERLKMGGAPRLVGKAVEVIGLHKNGHEFPIEVSLSAWLSPAGWQFGALIRDISERRQRDENLQHLASHDPLTGLLNRRVFSDRLEEILKSSRSTIVFVIDLDGFKNVNDTLGHLMGDDLLRIVSVRIAANLPPEALFARLGGDEFAVMLPNCEDPIRALQLCGEIMSAFDQDFSIGAHELPLSASIGFAMAPFHAQDAEGLLLRADLALIEAKQKEGGAFRVFDIGIENKLIARRAFSDEVRQATVDREWELHFQPQILLADNRLVGAEALLRWKHPKRGLIRPGVFIETLEMHAVASEVGRWTISEACGQLVCARKKGLDIPTISVNLFARQLRMRGIERTVLEILEQHGLMPSDLELELTESIVLQQDTKSLSELSALRQAGVRLAFDDFGTGFASLSTLKNFPVDKIKIDKSFVAELNNNKICFAIVGSIIHIAKELNIDVVAEGIENTEQLDIIKDLGCNIGQGFFWGIPNSDPFKLSRLNIDRFDKIKYLN